MSANKVEETKVSNNLFWRLKIKKRRNYFKIRLIK